jgi:hypothetical protein
MSSSSSSSSSLVEVAVRRRCKQCSAATRQKCGACKSVYYCSVACSVADWNQHKKVCDEAAAARKKK